jgi:hypothetical protein
MSAIPVLEQGQIGQRIPEYRMWVALCMQMRIRSYVELGSGAAHYLYKAGVPTCLSIDINNESGPLHNPHRDRGVTYIAGNSHDPKTVSRALDLLGGPPDCVFIDADHNYAPARSDFELWWPVATRLVGFHDILIPDVKQLWNEICLGIPSVEIVARDYASAASWQGPGAPADGRLSGGGIGILFKE